MMARSCYNMASICPWCQSVTSKYGLFTMQGYLTLSSQYSIHIIVHDPGLAAGAIVALEISYPRSNCLQAYPTCSVL